MNYRYTTQETPSLRPKISAIAASLAVVATSCTLVAWLVYGNSRALDAYASTQTLEVKIQTLETRAAATEEAQAAAAREQARLSQAIDRLTDAVTGLRVDLARQQPVGGRK
jgi:outer membrane murein-binding lipoprotein Lpp